MKKKLYAAAIFTGLVAIIVSFFSAVKSDQRAQAEKQKAVTAQAEHEKMVKGLNTKIERLEQSTAALEKQLSEFKSQTTSLLPSQVPPPTSLAPSKPKVKIQPGTPFEEIPPGAPFEFNGQTYYLTPLSGSSQVSVNKR